LVSDVGNLLIRNDIGLKEAGYYTAAIELIKKQLSNGSLF
jgi:hypothetical protein